jgi:Cytochrome c552
MWNQGIHARSGVACAGCHMPYKREGALKISDHHVRSPLLNIILDLSLERGRGTRTRTMDENEDEDEIGGRLVT